MPVYEYRHEVTGQRIELVRPVAERDHCPPGYRRVTVPARLGVLTGALEDAHPDRAVPNALKQLEEKHSAREIARQSGFTVEQLKETWKS